MKMKSHRFTLALIAFFVSIGLVRAEQSAVPVSSPEMKKHEINIFGKCKFFVKNTMKGELKKGAGSGSVWIRLWPRSMDLDIPLTCYSRNDEKNLEMELGAKQVDGKWQPAGGYEYGCDRQKWSKFGVCVDVHNLPFLPEEHMRAIPLKGANWQGVGILVDDTTGRERTRQRNFRYCLYHAEFALCGRANVRNLMKPHNDVLATVLTVLNSIEFVDEVPTDPLATPPR